MRCSNIDLTTHLLFIGAEIKEEVDDELHQPLLNNWEREMRWCFITIQCKDGWHKYASNPTTNWCPQSRYTKLPISREYGGNKSWTVCVTLCNVGELPSPFLGPLMPSSAAISEGWRLRETSSFSLKRITVTDADTPTEDTHTHTYATVHPLPRSSTLQRSCLTLTVRSSYLTVNGEVTSLSQVFEM